MPSFNEMMNLIPASFKGLSYSEREELKERGHREYSESSSREGKAEGALKVIFAHYQRSAESAAVDGRSHCDFPEYVRHWLWADDTQVTGEARQYLDRLFATPEQPRIEKGKSYYY
jgi:hypothetical protein